MQTVYDSCGVVFVFLLTFFGGAGRMLEYVAGVEGKVSSSSVVLTIQEREVQTKTLDGDVSLISTKRQMES